jgi:hypothetical protein
MQRLLTVITYESESEMSEMLPVFSPKNDLHGINYNLLFSPQGYIPFRRNTSMLRCHRIYPAKFGRGGSS